MDINAIKSKLSQLQSTTSTKENFWKPEPGKQVVRVVPYKHNKDNPFIELYFHYNLGNNKTYLSPVSFGKPDPVSEFADKLKSTGNKDEWIQGKRLEPKMRTFAPVVVRGKESEGVKFWGFGKTVYQTLLNYMLDEDYGDITDPLEGRDVKVVCTKAPGRMWASTEVRPRGRSSVLCDDTSTSKKWINEIPSLDDMYTLKSYEELEKIVNDWLSGDESDTSESHTSRGGSTSDSFNKTSSSSNSNSSSTSSSSSEDTSKKYKSLDEAFADLEDI